MQRVVHFMPVLIAAVCCAWAPSIASAKDQGPAMSHLSVEVGFDRITMTEGGSAWIGVRFIIEDQWHLYWRNNGDSGMPISVTFDAPEGVQIGEIQWPAPQRHVYGHDSVDYIYEREVALLAEVTIDDRFKVGDPIEITTSFELLACQEACVFGMGERSVVITIAESTAMRAPDWMKKNQIRIPRIADLGKQIRWDGTDLLISVYGVEGINGISFFPYAPSDIRPVDPVNHGSSETGQLRVAYPPEIMDAPRVAGVLEIDARMGEPYWIEIETTPPKQATDAGAPNEPTPTTPQQRTHQPINDRSGD
jgi:thiol:disulfide interchange protein DsbD